MKTKNNTTTTKKSVKKLTADKNAAGIEKKFKRIRTICDSFDHDFDDAAEYLQKIAKIAGSKNRIVEDDDYDDED